MNQLYIDKLPKTLKNAYNNSLKLTDIRLYSKEDSYYQLISFFGMFHELIKETLNEKVEKLIYPSEETVSTFNKKTIDEIIACDDRSLLTDFDAILFDIFNEYPLMKDIVLNDINVPKITRSFAKTLKEEVRVTNEDLFSSEYNALSSFENMLLTFESGIQKSNNVFLNTLHLNVLKLLYTNENKHVDNLFDTFKSHIVENSEWFFKYPRVCDCSESGFVSMAYYNLLKSADLFFEMISQIKK